MKKIVSMIACAIMLCCFSITVFADEMTATISGVPDEIKVDETTTITVSLSDCPTITSACIQIILSDGLELVSGEWVADGVLKDFIAENGYGVIALDEAGALDGDVFRFDVKGKIASEDTVDIKVDFIFKNGSTSVGTESVSQTLKVICATHSYGDWIVTKEVSCLSDGQKTRQCIVCACTETEAIACRGEHIYTDKNDFSCNDCDYVRCIPGDVDDDTEITDRDAVYLLYHTFLPDLYPVRQDCDFNGDGEINDKDAVYLLYHTFLPDLYPISE